MRLLFYPFPREIRISAVFCDASYSRFGLGTHAVGESDRLHFLSTEERRAKLFGARFGVGSRGIWTQVMATLLVWNEVHAIY